MSGVLITFLLLPHPTYKVDYWLAAFILEARRKDGQYYPPNTVKNIPAAIFRHMKANLGAHNVPNMIDKCFSTMGKIIMRHGEEEHFSCDLVNLYDKQLQCVTLEMS